MASFTGEEVLSVTNGICQLDVKGIEFKDVSTDTRTIESGCLFVALKGDTFDGHHFIPQAMEKGATGALVEKGRVVPGIPCIEVDDTLLGYQQLARYHRRRYHIPVVAITGSSGKTTTKDMVAAVLGSTYNVLKTEKNFNNEIGLPKTLLQLTDEHQACVVEMGMRGLGQIEELALIAEPTVGIITNVGTSHIELLGSREGIAQAKSELIRCLPADGIAILNEDDDLVAPMRHFFDGKTISYGIVQSATVRGSHLKYQKDGIKFTCRAYDKVFSVFLPMIGEYNVYDSLAAIAAGLLLDVPEHRIVRALKDFVGTPMRQEIVSFPDIVVLNDAYNANPASMTEAIKALDQLEGKRKIAMLGDMLELGDYTEEAHRNIGKLLAEEGYDAVFTFGDAAAFIGKETKTRKIPTFSCNSHLEMANQYKDMRTKGDVILVKGSRGLRMERVVEELREQQPI